MSTPVERQISPRQAAFEIALATFSILVLELAVIRWMSQQIRVFAYLNNLLLIGAFLGMGVGLGLARRRTGLIRLQLPLIALLAALLAFSRELTLMDLSFPDISIALWGADGIRRGETFLSTLATIVALFALVAAIFACGGNFVGDRFKRAPALRSYSADLLGSLLGVLAMAAMSVVSTPPPVWFAVGGLPLLYLSRKWTDFVSFAAVVVLTTISIDGASFSPYNRLDLLTRRDDAGTHLVLAANRDFHQYLYDLSDPAVTNRARAALRFTYDLPFIVTENRGRALVVGAGTGNDVAAALRNDFQHVTSVDIDRQIIAIGEKFHPERPYSDPRVTAVVNDARNFFENYEGDPFDVVCFGLLDSHAMFSAMSTLRLDNYVYTADGLASAWELVRPGGVMAVTFQVWQGEWLAQRITAAIEAATGQKPLVFGGDARTFIVSKPGAPIDVPHSTRRDTPDTEGIRVTTDDWPFLYLRPGVFPFGYVAVLSLVLILGAAATRYAYGREMFTRRKFDLTLFFMGAAFLLIETRGVTDLSLLFGSTWIVNSAVFGGILLVALVANLWIERRPASPSLRWFVPLLVSLMVCYFVRPSALLQLPFELSGIAGALLNAAPIGFAAIIFSSLLRESSDPASALGSNLLGAVCGGCLEYVSLYAGLRSVTLIAAALYLLALLFARRQRGRVHDS